MFEAASHHMLERKQSRTTTREEYDSEFQMFNSKFISEDRKPFLSRPTLFEELLCQTSFTLLGPIASLWIVPICGVNGARITGFLPGSVPLPYNERQVAQGHSLKDCQNNTNAKLEGDGAKSGSGTPTYIFQIFWFVAFTLPMELWIVFYVSGNLVLVDEWNSEILAATNYTRNMTENGEVAASLFGSSAQPTEILPVAEVFLPFAILILRQIVIAIKYAYRPRRQMRFERLSGRDMLAWGDDMLGSYVLGFPRVEAVIREAERAAWRVGVMLHMVNLQFDEEISDSVYDCIDIVEKSPSKEDKKSAKKQDQTNDLLNPDGKSQFKNKKNPQMQRPDRRNILSLRAAIKYAAFTASKIKLPGYVNPMSLIPIAIPFAYRLFHGRPAFGYSHFDKFVAATAMFRILDSSNTMLSFASAAGVLFDRQRLALDRWISLLISPTVSDAREVYHAVPTPGNGERNVFTELPDFSLTPQNIYAWDMGRRALKKIGIVYSLRLEKFLAVYLFVLSVTVTWMVVDVLIKAATGQTIVLTAGLLMVVTFCFALIVVFFGIVFSGMYTNRQQKLHAAALTSLRLRVEIISQCKLDRLLDQLQKLREAKNDNTDSTGHKNKQSVQEEVLAQQIKSERKQDKDTMRALKLIANEIEKESETQKIRILGMSVDTRMLEALMGLLSALGVTLWQAISN